MDSQIDEVWCVIRQDDHGNRVVMKEALDRATAEKVANE
jgi:hypothetical protein